MKEQCPFCNKTVQPGALVCTKCGAHKKSANTDGALILIMGGAMAIGVGVSFSHNQALGWGTIAAIAGALYFLVQSKKALHWVEKE